MKKFLLALTILLFPALALAADFRIDESGSINLGKAENLKNVYAAGNTIKSDANIKGDLMAAGNTIGVTNKIENDLFAAGNNINISAEVGGNVRIAGSNITVDNKIGGDLLAGGSNIQIGQDTVIDGDLIAGGGTITVDGKINGNAKISASALSFSHDASVSGKLTYWADQEITIPDGVVKGGVEFRQIEKKSGWMAKTGILTLAMLYKLIGMIVALLVLVALLPKNTKEFLSISFSRTWAALGIGFVVLVLTPIAFILLCVSMIGISLAFILIFAYIVALIIAGLSTPLLLGHILFNGLKNKELKADWKTIVVGSVGIIIIGLIPIIGWLAIAILFLISLGASTLWIFDHLKEQRK